MTSSENNFEQQWQAAFKDASLPPPGALWEQIAEQLEEDTKQKAIFVLWGMPAYLTSGIAATLILAFSALYFFGSADGIDTKNSVSIIEKKSGNANRNASKTTDVTEFSQPVEMTTTAKLAAIKSSNSELKKNNLKEKNSLLITDNQQFTEHNKNISTLVSFANLGINTKSERIVFTENLSSLLSKSFEEYTSRYTLKRNKLAYEFPNVSATKKDTPERRSWIGFISGISPFKPNFQAGNFDAVAANSAELFKANDANFSFKETNQSSNSLTNPSFTLPNAAPIQQFSVGRAINVGIQAGKKLTKRLALETGLRYIRGNSPSKTNAFTLNTTTGDINTFYQDYLTNKQAVSNTVVAIEDAVRNEYEYLIIPVQLAYQIPLNSKLSFKVSAGVSADTFLKNTIESETTETALLNSSNSVFRTVGMSGLGGVRLSYLLDEKWELTIGSSLQKALVSNFTSATSAKLRPQMLGVNYGVNYHF